MSVAIRTDSEGKYGLEPRQRSMLDTAATASGVVALKTTGAVVSALDMANPDFLDSFNTDTRLIASSMVTASNVSAGAEALSRTFGTVDKAMAFASNPSMKTGVSLINEGTKATVNAAECLTGLAKMGAIERTAEQMNMLRAVNTGGKALILDPIKAYGCWSALSALNPDDADKVGGAGQPTKEVVEAQRTVAWSGLVNAITGFVLHLLGFLTAAMQYVFEPVYMLCLAGAYCVSSITHFFIDDHAANVQNAHLLTLDHVNIALPTVA